MSGWAQVIKNDKRKRRAYHGRIEKMNSPTIDIASKELRARIAEGNPIIYYVPDEVAAYIRENNIYKDCDKDEI